MTEGVLRNFGVVIPVGNLQIDRKNIELIVSQNEEYFIETILVLDNQELVEIEQLEQFINTNHFTNTKIVHGVWNNPGGARNFGLSFCTRTLVSFWDSDDTQFVINVEKAVNELLNSDFDAGVCVFEISGENFSKLEKLPRMKSDKESLLIRFLSNPGLWRIIFRRSAVTDIIFPEISSAEDQIFLLRFLQINPQVCQINLLTYSYVQGGENQLTKSLSINSFTLQAIDLGIKELRFLDQNWKKLGQLLLLKLIFSVIRRGSFTEKVLAIKKLKKLLLQAGLLDLICALGIVPYFFLVHRS